MEIIIINAFQSKWEKWEKIKIDFDSKVPVNTGTLRSLAELVTLKNIEKEVREYLGVDHWRTRVISSMTKTEVFITDEGEYLRIKTIVKRDNIIENILNHDR